MAVDGGREILIKKKENAKREIENTERETENLEKKRESDEKKRERTRTRRWKRMTSGRARKRDETQRGPESERVGRPQLACHQFPDPFHFPDPFRLPDLENVRPLLWVCRQTAVDCSPQHSRARVGKGLEPRLNNVLRQCQHVCRRKRRREGRHLIQQAANTPDIRLFVVRLALDDFRARVRQRADGRLH